MQSSPQDSKCSPSALIASPCTARLWPENMRRVLLNTSIPIHTTPLCWLPFLPPHIMPPALLPLHFMPPALLPPVLLPLRILPLRFLLLSSFCHICLLRISLLCVPYSAHNSVLDARNHIRFFSFLFSFSFFSYICVQEIP